MINPLPLLRHFRKLPDPRIDRRKLHSLDSILAIALCAVISGAQDFQQIALFGSKRIGWLGRFLDLPNGIPSHDTFERVFSRLDPVAFQACFARWMAAWHARLTGKHLAVDGKAVRGSASPGQGLRCLSVVNAWATEAKLCLGMVACDADSNEITAIPELLALLELKGALVSLDAGGCQKAIAGQVVAGGGDYLMVVKKNQGDLHAGIKAFFEGQAKGSFAGLSLHHQEGHGHGREECRLCVVAEAPEGLKGREGWPSLGVIGMCFSIRKVGEEEETREIRYFIGSKEAKARYYAKRMRAHWGVENNCHWQLDVTFREDASQVRERTAQTNLATVRRLALNLVKQEKADMSLAKKRFAAALDIDYLEEILKA